MREADPSLPEVDSNKICLGVLGICDSELVKSGNGQRTAFDFYLDTMGAGTGYFWGGGAMRFERLAKMDGFIVYTMIIRVR